MISITRAAARELGDDKIRVNCIAPGLTMSDGTRNNKSWTEAARAANVASRSLKRDAEPDDLVGALVFLASADSAFMTGHNASRRWRFGDAVRIVSVLRQDVPGAMLRGMPAPERWSR